MSDQELSKFIRLLEDGRVDVNATDTADGMNALLKLTRNYGHDNLINLIQLLINERIDVNATDPNGWNALHNLCYYYVNKNLVDLIRLLENSTIDMEVKTREGYSALYICTYANPTVVPSGDIPKILYKGNDFSKVENVYV